MPGGLGHIFNQRQDSPLKETAQGLPLPIGGIPRRFQCLFTQGDRVAGLPLGWGLGLIGRSRVCWQDGGRLLIGALAAVGSGAGGLSGAASAGGVGALP